jgi:hypothetical protein
MKRWLTFFIAGGSLGSIGDYFHKLSGITIYPPMHLSMLPFFPLWTTLLFGAAGVTLGLGYQWFQRFRHRIKFQRKSSLYLTLTGGVLFLGIYAFSALVGNWHAPIPDISLAALSILFWLAFDGTRGGLIYSIAVCIAGTGVEITLVHLGIFSYGNNTSKILGVASWLPWLYLAAATASLNLSRLTWNRKRRGRRVYKPKTIMSENG